MLAKKKFYSTITLLLFAHILHAEGATLDSAACAKPVVWMTVFVHGIMSIKPHLGFGNFVRFYTDNITNSVYETTVHNMRQDSHFFQNQAMQQLGLQPIDIHRLQNPQAGDAAAAMATVFDQVLLWSRPESYGTNYYYTFGWSGLLSRTVRRCEGVKFYNELCAESARLEAIHGVKPHIRVIGYSHGGNVSLNLAAGQYVNGCRRDITIDELLMFAVPIQKDTDYRINDPIFKKIYHFFSTGDHIQRLDIFTADRLFSRQKFKGRRNFELPDKLTQIQIKLTKNNENLPLSGQQYPKKHRQSRAIITAAPGHMEFWFFGWTPLYYRSTFPIYPLPTVTFAPFIIHCLNDLPSIPCLPRHVVVAELQLDAGTLVLRNRKETQIMAIDPLPSAEKLNELRDLALLFKPYHYPGEEYNARIEAAKDSAIEAHYKKEAQKKKKIRQNRWRNYPG